MQAPLKYHSWLEVSQEDLKASKLLFDNKLYPQSIFYYQQAVEKLIKYFGLKNNIIQEKETRRVSHASSKIFKKAIKQLHQHIPLNSDVDKDFVTMKEFITSNPEEIVVPKVIELIQNAYEQKNKSPYDIGNIETLEDFYKIAKRWYPDDPNVEKCNLSSNDEILRPYLNKIFQSAKKRHYSYSVTIKILFILNTLTETVVGKVRYPKEEDGMNPSDIYNNHNPLVQSLPYFFETLENNIEVFKID